MMIGTFAIAALLLASSAADQQGAMRFRATLTPAAVKDQGLFEGRKGPFTGIFPDRAQQPEERLQNRTPPAAAETQPQPRIVCGMLLIPADPRIDPKIAWGDRGAKVVNPDPKIAWPVRQCTDK
jgi:hypothetical protein